MQVIYFSLGIRRTPAPFSNETRLTNRYRSNTNDWGLNLVLNELDVPGAALSASHGEAACMCICTSTLRKKEDVFSTHVKVDVFSTHVKVDVCFPLM
jgi:hypothetical protein